MGWGGGGVGIWPGYLVVGPGQGFLDYILQLVDILQLVSIVVETQLYVKIPLILLFYI